MVNFHSFKASGSTFSRLHQGLMKSFNEVAISLRLLKSFNEVAISLQHLEKSILEGNLYLEPLKIIL